LITVLLADDDAIVRKILGPILERSGFTVLTATDGIAALERSRCYSGTIDVLVSDLDMPGLSGLELAATLSQSRPELKILLISALADTPSDLRKDWVFLRKPFSPGVLLEKLEEVSPGHGLPEPRLRPAKPQD
jgi:CheY-like chemotaxis protein